MVNNTIFGKRALLCQILRGATSEYQMLISFDYSSWTKYKTMFLKPENKNQINWQCYNFKNILINDFHHQPFLCWAKVLQTLFFRELKITNWKDQTINHSNIYFLFDLLLCRKKHFVKLYNQRKFDLSCSIETKWKHLQNI